MPGKQHPGLKSLLRPIAKRIPRVASTIRFIRPRPGERVKFLSHVWRAPRIQSEPDVYPFAAYLAEQLSCTHVITIGRPTARDLRHVYPKLEILGFVPGDELALYRRRFGFGKWIDAAKLADPFSLPENVLARAIIVCSDLDQWAIQSGLLDNLRSWLAHAPLCIVTNADREVEFTQDRPATVDAQTVDSNLAQFEERLRRSGFGVEFIGWTAADNVAYAKKTILAILNKTTTETNNKRAPADFRVVAFMAAYNEEDIIVQSIRKWTDQGIAVHVLENWSTDSTYALVKELTKNLPVTLERFPADGPSKYFEWEAMLERIETLSKKIQADWFVRRGADEVLVSPWPELSYKDALYLVDRAGFNCIDHTIIDFHPVDDGFRMGMDHEAYFRHFDFNQVALRQRKAWKNGSQTIATIHGGHDLEFEGRRVYPFKFLLKHYSLRSQRQAEKKVFAERKARWNPNERAKGWHNQYDAIKEGHRFVKATAEKIIFDTDNFYETYLVERLAGIGTHRGK
jgi:hypothetical protein